jgi:ribosomal protein S18 acetylase RimI-like enzyme
MSNGGRRRLAYLELTGPETVIAQGLAPLPAGHYVRPVELDADASLIAELYDAIFQPDDPSKVTPQEVTRLDQHPGLSPTGVFLAFDRELAVGLAVGRVDVPKPDHAGHRGAIELLAVRPGYRRRGIGRALIYAVLGWLADRDVVTVSAAVEDPEVQGVLKRYGFRPVAASE